MLFRSVAPPETPQDRVDVLRAAFEKTMRDEEFIAEIRKLNLEHRPITGQRAAALVEELFKTPQPVIERVRKMTQGP